MIINNYKINIGVVILLIGFFLLPLTVFSKENSTVLISEIQSASCNLSVEATILKQPDCGQANGSVCLTVAGATGAVSYSWGADIACYETLYAGDYCVYVTDAENCKDSVLFTLTEVCDIPCNLDITAEIKRQPECGKDNGWVCITATGGTGNLSYSWGADIACYETLTPGEYCVYVTDEKNCKDSVLFKLDEPMCNEPCGLKITAEIKRQPECGKDNGWVCITTTGGTGNLSYSWGADIACYETLTPGEYCVYVTDEKNCKDSVLFKLDEPMCDEPCGLKITAEIKRQPECGKDNGWVCITATGGTGNLSYSWGADIPCYETLTPGEYCVYVTDEKNCKDSVLFTLIEENCQECTQFRDIAISGTKPSCDTDNGIITVSFSGNADNVTYTWEDDATLNTATRTDLGEGTYTVTVSNGMATCDTSLTIILIKEDGMAFLELTPSEVCPGEAGKIDFKLQGCFTLPVKVDVFDKDGNVVASIESIDGSGSIGGLNAGVNYILGATDSNGGNTVMQSFEIANTPEIDLKETVSSKCDAKGFIMLEPADGQSLLTFDWTDQEGTDNGGTRADLSAGSYVVNITDQNGCKTDKLYIIEEPSGPDFSTEKEILSCFQDSLQLLIVNNKETDTLDYVWKFPSDIMANATDVGNPTIYSENALTKIIAQVTVTNQFDCVLIDSISITMRDTVSKPTIDFSTMDNCNSTTIDFINNSTDSDLFIWNFGDPNSEDDVSTEKDPSYTYAKQGAYDVTLELNPAFQCDRQPDVSTSKTVMVEAPIMITADYSFDIDICNKPDTVEFANASTTNRDFIEQFIWVLDGVIAQEGGETLKQDVSELASFDLSLIAISGTCSDTISQNITFPKVEDTTITVVPCMGESVELVKFFPLPNATYNWEENTDFEATLQNPIVSVDTITEYRGTAQNEDGCVQLEYVLKPQDAPNYTKEGNPNVCTPEELTDISIAADEESEIIWYESNDFLESLDVEDPNRMVVAGTYYFEVDNGCIMADSIIVTERLVNVSPTGPESFCRPSTTQLSLINQNAEDTLSYNWLALPAPNNTAATPEVMVDKTTEFEVEVTNQYGCQSTIIQSVIVGDTTLLASQELVAAQNNLAPGGPTELSFSPPLPDGYTVEWQSDPTLEVNGITATVTPEETMTYVATIIPESGDPKCGVPRRVTINVGCNPDGVYFPNAFSPNGDGNNEILEVKGAEGLESMNLIIFNRWGQKVFESNSPERGWDGVFEGEPVCADVYGYYLTITCPTSTIVKKGNITVLK